MKEVLISIQPYWVFLIIAKKMGWKIDKEKTIEVRKSFPKAEDWNRKAEIYCSKDKKSFDKIPKEYQPFMEKFLGKVVGRFTCDRISSWQDHELHITKLSKLSCVSIEELLKYSNNFRQNIYGWHISDLKVYDKPRELKEFTKYIDCKKYYDCCACPNWDRLNLKCIAMNNELTRPPQSWQFIESLGE